MARLTVSMISPPLSKEARGALFAKKFFVMNPQSHYWANVLGWRLVMAPKHFSGTTFGLEFPPLKAICPRLFRISTLQNAFVSSCGFWDGCQWKWALSWKRALRPHDTQEKKLLISILNRVVLSPDGADHLIWTPDKLGDFSVKSFSMELAKTSTPNHIDSIKGMWGGLIPFRIEIFSWFALLGKLNTRTKLAKLGMITLAEDKCTLCGEANECCDHLLLHCPFSWNLWQWWMNIWGISWAFPSKIRSSYEQWQFPRGGILFKKVWKASFFVIMWTIWKERNMRIFDNKLSSREEVRDLVLLRLS